MKRLPIPISKNFPWAVWPAWFFRGALWILFVFMLGCGSGSGMKAVTVIRGSIDNSLLSTGVVQPENRLEIKAPIAGRADAVLVKEGETVVRGQMLLQMSSTERAALLDAARARGPSELARWEAFYKPTPVLAPIDGTIIVRTIEPGQTFTTQEAILVMSDRLTVQAQVDETDIAAIHNGQEAVVTLDAYPSEKMKARVEAVAFDAKTVNNVTTYLVTVLPEKIPPFMRSGMTANVRFLSGARSESLLVPVDAVKNRDGHSFVIREASGKNETEVQTGLSDGKRIEIVSGLQEGDTVWIPQRRNTPAKGGNPFSPMGRH